MKTMFSRIMSGLVAVFMMSSMAGVFTSCSDDGGTLETPAFEAEAAKYEISGSSEYRSIELTESGNYIIIKNGYGARSQKVKVPFLGMSVKPALTRVSYNNNIYGKYTKAGENTYNLEGFGIVKVLVKDGAPYALEVTPNGGETDVVVATVQNKNASSDMTNRLCRTWTVEKMYYEWVDEEGSESGTYTKEDALNSEEFEFDGWPESVVFTKTGTYMVSYDDQTLAVSTWKWYDESKGLLCYSWENDFEDIDEDDLVTIEFDGATLIVTQEYEESGDGWYEKEKMVTYLKEAE